jgi:ATP-dependent RNA helicase SUPV3L1/SUV3
VTTPETMEIAVWWPDGMGPFKARAPRPERHRPDHTKDHAKREHAPKKSPKRFEKPERKPEKPKRPEKPMDPNSPFAVLGALKASLGKGSS